MSEVIQFYEPKNVDPVCSFCGRKKSDVPRLFSNGMDDHNARFMCSHCVLQMKRVLDQEMEPVDA